MNTGEVYDLFRSLIDEPDETFLTEAQAQLMCDLGYREFRQTVTDIDPEVYVERFHVTPSGREYDLAGSLFLSPAGVATNPAQRIVRVGQVDSAANDSLSFYLVPTQTPVQVENLEGDYCLQNTSLVFGGRMSGSTLRIEYIPESTITKTSWANGNNTKIDNLAVHHPLIALYAARYYMIRDGAPNTTLIAQMDTKETALRSYLTVGRNTDGTHYIVPMRGYSKVVVS
jgi:hypothetical protein